ncbi:MAG TPA: aldo/keto reductase [Gemmatimonadaceae bacterium]|nr:aldo/keto reductase [Gemmatimonadaceae bacterium]
MHNRSRPFPLSTERVGTPPLRATADGTARFADRFAPALASDFFRSASLGLTLSSLGIGTYLGDNTEGDDAAYEDSVRTAIQSGVNVIDTAINYRCQRSERAIGAALQRAFASGDATREELVVCTKGGYVPLDRTPPETREEYQAYLKREFFDPQVLHADDLVGGGHSLAPRFLRYCIAKSRQNLGLRTIDVYYVHNPEQQLASVSVTELFARLRAAFGVLEEAATRGEIGVYGLATWDALRSPRGEKGALELEAVVNLAREVGGDEHHLRAVQLPINLAMLEAVRGETQPIADKMVTAVAAAQALGVTVFGSATLMQSRLAANLPPTLAEHFPWCATDAQRAVAFARSLPGVTTSLIGMRSAEHVRENLASAPPTPSVS